MVTFTSKEHIVSALRKGIRMDGRKLDEYRPVSVEVGCLKNGEGSARVTCGDTQVLAGVKLSIGTPYADRPESGVFIVNAELLPLSNPEFESGPPSIDSIELSRVIDRGIRESHTIAEDKLCITPGEKVWMVNLDILPLNTDGHLFDAGGLASLAALWTTRLPAVDETGLVNYKELTDEKLPAQAFPIPVTTVKIGDQLLLDPTWEEWRLADARLTVTSLEDGTLCAMQKGGDSTLTLTDIEQAIAWSIEKGKEFRELVKEAIKA